MTNKNNHRNEAAYFTTLDHGIAYYHKFTDEKVFIIVDASTVSRSELRINVIENNNVRLIGDETETTKQEFDSIKTRAIDFIKNELE